MKPVFLFAISSIWIFAATGQGIPVGHSCTNLSSVPSYYIGEAKNNLKIWYGHTSHGSQITSGIENLQNHIGDPYTFNPEGSGGALSYQENGSVDLGHNGDTTWAQITRQVLNAPGNNRNVIMWSWCGGVSDNTEEGINIYLNKMTELANDYPGVQFVYMTGHLDIWSYLNLKARNQQIRDYCSSNDKILFDFADIESYDPSQTYFEYATDNCDYYSGPGGTVLGNWAEEWCAANPGSDLCWDCSCAHSRALNCNLKGRAFWWMMARMAGWDGAVGIPQNSEPGHGIRCWYADGAINIQSDNVQDGEGLVTVYDRIGRMNYQTPVNLPVSGKTIAIPAPDLLPGIYFIRMERSRSMLVTGKVVVSD
jgi:hypothetical protein